MVRAMSATTSYVDRNNRELAEVRADMFGGDGLITEIEILRGDLAGVQRDDPRHPGQQRGDGRAQHARRPDHRRRPRPRGTEGAAAFPPVRHGLGGTAFCASPISGQGTSLAVVGAYLLAGELARAEGDHEAAFAGYERRMRPWVTTMQRMGRDNVRWFAPRNTFERWMLLQAVRWLPRLPWSDRLVRRMLPTRNEPQLPAW